MKKHVKTQYRKWYNAYTKRLLGKDETGKVSCLGDYKYYLDKAWRNKQGIIRMEGTVFMTWDMMLRRLWTNPRKAKRNRRKTIRK